MLKRVLAGILLVLLLTSGTAAGPFDQGFAAYGRGDYATALQLWRPPAEKGHAEAQYFVGGMYESGEGVPQNYAEAMKWYRLAAEQGPANAQNSVGVMYLNGEGVPQDHAEAVKWFSLAAEQGYARGQSDLGLIYYTGQGVPQDYVQAHMWFDLAASYYRPWHAEEGDRAVRNRDVVASKMTPAQTAEAQRLAREWKPK